MNARLAIIERDGYRLNPGGWFFSSLRLHCLGQGQMRHLGRMTAPETFMRLLESYYWRACGRGGGFSPSASKSAQSDRL